MTVSTSRALWIGTYPAPGEDPGSGEGIWSVDVDPADGRVLRHDLVAPLVAPSFLALAPAGRTLYAVSETPAGTVSAFGIDDAGGRTALTPEGAGPSGGDSPCHLLARPGVVWTANYGDGVVAAVRARPEGPDGEPRVFAGSGSGPATDRQDGPHAHYVADVGDRVLVSDLGADVLRAFTDGPDGPAEDGVAATLPPGTGPRHLVELPDGSLVVVGELDARAHVLVRDGAGWSPASSVPVQPGAEGGTHFPAHVTLSADGTRLHVTVRGSDVLAVHGVRPPAADGGPPVLEHLTDVPLGEGGWPRHHAVVGAGPGSELVVVALQGRSELVAVRLDLAAGAGSSGVAGEVTARQAMPTPPACVLVA